MEADKRPGTNRVIFRRTNYNKVGSIIQEEFYEVCSEDLDDCFETVKDLRDLEQQEEKNDRKITDPSIG